MITIREVHTAKDLKTFTLLPWKVYQGDPYWVPPLIGETMKLLDKKKSPFFDFGEAGYFLAYRDHQPVGRITAHINHRHNQTHQVKEGFFGFYECLNDEEAAVALLGAAEDWVRQKGMTKIIGPESFSIYDETCFLADGWEALPRIPAVMTTYTPPYYLEHMHKAGLAKEIDWYAFVVQKGTRVKPVFLKMKDRLHDRYGFIFRNIDFKHLDQELPKIKHIFDHAWAENWGHFPLTDRQFDFFKEALQAIADPRLCWIVEDKDQPVGCIVNLPDINPAVQKMNGRLLPWGWWHFLQGRKQSKGLRTFLAGVDQGYRHKGVDIAMIAETITQGVKLGYEWSECSLIVENNHRMIEPVKKWGGELTKTWRLFSKTW